LAKRIRHGPSRRRHVFFRSALIPPDVVPCHKTKTAAQVVSAAVEEITCSITLSGDANDADRLIDGLADMIHRYLFD
jgi:hypothetical protein